MFLPRFVHFSIYKKWDVAVNICQKSFNRKFLLNSLFYEKRFDEFYDFMVEVNQSVSNKQPVFYIPEKNGMYTLWSF